MTVNNLENELKYFEEHRKELCKDHLLQYVLIKDTKLIGIFDDDKAAYREGIKLFGLSPFLIKQVTENDNDEKNLALHFGLINAGI